MFEQFLKPASVDEAVRFKSQFKDDSVFIAGGGPDEGDVDMDLAGFHRADPSAVGAHDRKVF